MNAPTRLKILHLDFAVEWIDAKHAAIDSNFGFTHTDHLVVSVCKDEPAERQVEIMMHELAHVIWWLWGLGKKSKEEEIVTAIGRGYASIFRDNPDLVAWLGEVGAG